MYMIVHQKSSFDFSETKSRIGKLRRLQPWRSDLSLGWNDSSH